jgi:mRNA-degrading endonuclease toxin of MazEF toxin-antitoxin module
MRTSRAIHTEIGLAEHQEAVRAVLSNYIRRPCTATSLLAQTTSSLRTIPSRSPRSSRLTGAQTNSQCVGLTTRVRAIDTSDPGSV